MIKNIELNGVATFKNIVNMKPSLVNYIYGFNGSGKTTLSNVLKKPELYTNCIVEKDNEEMKVLVYNKEFVDGLFKYPSTLKGIFTLGKDSGETLKIIDESKERIKSLRKNNDELGKTLGEALIEPTRIYVKALKNVKEAGVTIKGCSHITGGGFYENIPRMLPDGVKAVVKKDSYKVPALFDLLAKEGDIAEEMMYNTFNMGIGMVLAIDEPDVEKTMEALKAAGETCYELGYVEAGEKGVELC